MMNATLKLFAWTLFLLPMSSLGQSGNGEALQMEASSIYNMFDLEISVPNGWVETQNNSNVLLLVNSELEAGYKRNIMIRSFNGSEYIDEISAKKFHQMILQKFRASLGKAIEYRAEDPGFLTLENGNEAITVYAFYTQSGLDMMQINMVVSSPEKHYLITYTDVASLMMAEDSPSFERAWQILQNIRVPFSGGTSRYDTYLPYAVGGGVVFFSFLTFFITRRIRQRRNLELAAVEVTMDDDKYSDDESSDWVVASSKEQKTDAKELDFDPEEDSLHVEYVEGENSTLQADHVSSHRGSEEVGGEYESVEPTSEEDFEDDDLDRPA